MEKMQSPCCQLCGVKEKTVYKAGHQACPSCCILIDTLRRHPTIIKKLQSHIIQNTFPTRNTVNTVHTVSTSIHKESDLPEVLDGKRYRTIDRDQNKWYLSVSEVDGQPVEIFASTAFDRDHELQSRISNLTTITRLISLILRHVFLNENLTLKKCLKQIKRSSRNKNDLPDMLYRVLSRYPEATGAFPKKSEIKTT